MMNISLQHYLAVSLVLFTIGTIGVVVRRNALIIFMSIELMLNAVNIVFLAFSRWLGIADGQLIVFFVLAVAAAEAAVGLGIVVAVFRNKATVDVDDLRLLKG